MNISSDVLAEPWRCATVENPDLAALLFDLDGTLVDTMSLHHLAYASVFSQYGGVLMREDFDTFSGPPAVITIPRFARAAGIDPFAMPETSQLHAEKKVAFEQLLQKTPLTLLPAARLLLEKRLNFQIAVVTSGNTSGARAILEASGLTAHVEVLVTGDDVSFGKPDPEPYRLALTRLGKDSRQGLAFEDHDNGIVAATLAGLAVIDVRGGILIPTSVDR